MTRTFVGIDLSESRLSVAVHQSDYRFECAVDSRAAEKLISALQPLSPAQVALQETRDASETPIAAALHAAGFPTTVVDAKQVQKFAANTCGDHTRAEELAALAATLNETRDAIAPAETRELKALLERRAQLVEMLAGESKERRTDQVNQRVIQSLVLSIERRISGVDSELRDRLRKARVWCVNSKVRQSSMALVFVSVAAVIAGALLVLPLWIVKYPPLLDYPNHLARVFILAHINDPNYQFFQYYSVDFGPYPYLTMDVLLLGLQKFLTIFTGGKIILSLCVVGVPLAGWFFVRETNRDNPLLACWLLLSGYNIFFLWGFVNWQLGNALVLVVAGLWVRYLNRPTVVRWLALLLVVTALYFTHLQGYGLAGLIVTGYGALTRKAFRPTVRALLVGWALFVPGACLHLITRIISRQTEGEWSFNFHPLSDKWDNLAYFIQGYSPRLDTITLLLFAACAFAAWWRNRQFTWNHPWPAITAGLFLLYWIFPGYGVAGAGDDADIRLLPFIFMLMPAVVRVGRRAPWLALVACLVFCARTGSIIRTFKAEQPELLGISRAFSLTPRNVRVLPVVESRDDDPQFRFYAHFSAYGLIERGWFSPYLLTIRKVTTVQVKSDLPRPEGFWDLEYEDDPNWDEIADNYDYVWAFHVPRFKDDLEEIGDLVYESGDLRLYKLKKDRRDKEMDKKPDDDSDKDDKAH